MMTDSDRDHLPKEDRWPVSIVGMHSHVMRALIQKLIEKNVLTAQEAQAVMFTAAERLRGGSDVAEANMEFGASDIAYNLATAIERLSDSFVAPKNNDTYR